MAAVNVCEETELRQVKVTCLSTCRRKTCHGCLIACSRALQVQPYRAALYIEYARQAHTYCCTIARAGLARSRRSMRPRSALRYRSLKTEKCQLVFLVWPLVCCRCRHRVSARLGAVGVDAKPGECDENLPASAAVLQLSTIVLSRVFSSRRLRSLQTESFFCTLRQSFVDVS